MKLKGRNKVSPEFSMSSMTDIVFLLLVFFMLTSNAPNALDLLLPKAKGKSTNVQNVSVSIDKDLNYYLDEKQLTKMELETALVNALKDREEPTIILRTEESVAVKEAVYVMDLAQQHRYKVILAVRPN
ncbi:MAG: biopolymer transporter ExbD [Flavobacteriaceae bacterium]|jgi:biopolymer transport protein ExbD|nr:biopolymer transporter ExbD [Flavobacteriaceae bacterium]NVJ72877.1 biopolymer transporter ExbD [Flavobacteriaceae bacterium]